MSNNELGYAFAMRWFVHMRQIKWRKENEKEKEKRRKEAKEGKRAISTKGKVEESKCRCFKLPLLLLPLRGLVPTIASVETGGVFATWRLPCFII